LICSLLQVGINPAFVTVIKKYLFGVVSCQPESVADYLPSVRYIFNHDIMLNCWWCSW